MKLSNIRDAPLIRANYLLSQEKNKKGVKAIQPEINKMSEIFGIDFDKRLYSSLFEEIDFKEMKSLINTKNIKHQYFFQEFSSLLDKSNFISLFSEILMKTENMCTTHEIFEGLNKVVKLSYENQFKILISFILSGNERFVSDAKNILLNKCKELEKEGKTDQLSQNTIQTLLLLVDSFEEKKKESINFLNFVQSNSYQSGEELKQISDIEKLLDMDTDEPIEIEKLYLDIGPYMVNNMIVPNENDLISYEIDEKRLSQFIISLLKHQNWNDDKECKFLNKLFLKSLNFENYKDIDESPDKKNVVFNIENFYLIFKEQIEQMEPKNIFTYLDDPNFSIKDKKKFDFFIYILKKLNLLNDNYMDTFYNFLFTKWTNELNQIELLEFLLANPITENFSFSNYSGKRVKKNFELSPTIAKSSSSYLIEPWTCIGLIEVLLKLSSGNYYVRIKKLFDWPIQNIPEIVAMGLISIDQNVDDFLYDELIQEVLTLFLGNHMNSFTVIEEVWNTKKDLVIRTISNMYNSSPDLMNLSRILDITQKLKDSLLLLVNCDDYKFAVNLAILAVKRDFLHIEQWLKERIEKVGDDFIIPLLDYIKENLIECKNNAGINKETILEKSQLTLESLALIFDKLVNVKASTNPRISARTEKEIKDVYKSIFETFDELQLQPVNSEEIEQTANLVFRQMFREETTVSQTIEKLKQYKDSPEQKEREIYACMIHCLLDEYRFYHQYPEKQLTTVSTLFGQIINHKLIEGVIETIALKYILEGIKKGSGPMYVFGTTALSQFINKLPELHSYLKSLIEVKQLKNSPALYEKVCEKYNLDREGNTSINNSNTSMNSMGSINNMTNMGNMSNTSNMNNMNALNMNNNGLAGKLNNMNSLNGLNNLNENNNNINLSLNNSNNLPPPPSTLSVIDMQGGFNSQNQSLNNNNQMKPNSQYNSNLMGFDEVNDPKSKMLKMINKKGTTDFTNSTTNMNINPNNLSNMNQNNSNMNPLNQMNFQANSSNKKDIQNFFGNQNNNSGNSNLNNSNNNLNQNNQNSQNSNLLDSFNIQMGNMNGMNLQNLNSNSMNNFNQNQLVEDEKQFKNYSPNSDMYNMSSNMNNLNNMQNMMVLPNMNSLSNISNMQNQLNQNSNLNNLNNSGLLNNSNSPSSPKRMSKTKLNKLQQGNSNINEILGIDNERVQSPSQDLIDNMKFIFNSMSKNNVSQKANEIKQLLNNDNTIKWFSNFFIVNRITGENNNHQIYDELISYINNKDLNNYLIKDTIKYINKLLLSDNIDKDLKEKSILKNLGNWLGLITLAKNKPILAKDLDLKEIIFNAYESGKLSSIISFISKILEHSSKTKVFHSKNPWMQAILSLLMELFSKPNLKQNLAFEIEGLFKKLNIDQSTYPKSKLLDKLNVPPNSQDFFKNTNNMSNTMGNNTGNPNQGGSNNSNNLLNKNILNSNANSLNCNILYSPLNGTNNNLIGPNNSNNSNQNAANADSIGQLEPISFSELYNKICLLDNYIINIRSLLNNHSQQMISKQELVSLLTNVLSESINEIIAPVVERAVNISLVTTKQLTIKDFVFDMDENKFQTSSANCIKSLAGSLALVTCKEPLRINYNTNLKGILQKKGYDQETIDMITNHQSIELLDIGCSYIHNYVIKKAIEKIKNDETIISEIERRQKGKLYDMKSILVTQSKSLPELIRPNKNGLTKEQLKIYENYQKIFESYSKLEQSGNGSFINIIIKLLKDVLESNNANNSNMKINKSYELCMGNIHNILQESSNSLETGDQLNILEKYISESKINNDPQLEKDLAYITFKYMLLAVRKKNMQLLNIYSTLIKGWTVVLPEIASDITDHLFMKSDIVTKFNIDLHLTLFKKNLIYFPKYESYILDLLYSNMTRKNCKELIMKLQKLNLCNLSQSTITNVGQNPSFLFTFKNIHPYMLDSSVCDNYFKLFYKKTGLPSNIVVKKEAIIDYKLCNIKDSGTYTTFINMCFAAFNQILEKTNPFNYNHLEKYQNELKCFLESPFIYNEEQMNVFIMIITESCVKRGLEEKNTSNNFYPENQAKIIYALLNIIPRNMNKIKIFGNILFGIFKTFHRDYVKSSIHFNQRPYYKLFFNLIYLICQHKNKEELFNSEFKKITYLILFGEFLRVLSPLNYPGFSLAWLDLISYKSFISSFLEIEPNTKLKENSHKFEKYLYLIIDLFSCFKSQSNKPIVDHNLKCFVDHVYKFMFLLCNSFPDFISSYYYIIIFSLPPGGSFLQLKNLILNCGPRDIEIPDPFAEEGKELTLEKRKNALILFDIASTLQDYGFKVIIDSYIDSKTEMLIDDLCKKLNKTKSHDFNFYVINAIVIYWSQKIIKQLQDKKLKCSDFSDFFTKMLETLDPENRDHLINSMLNELRYPSNQTILFSFLILFILSEIKNENIEEHIITNIFYRLTVKPIPWGLLHLLVQIMKNNKFDIFKRPFVVKNKHEELIQNIYLSAKNGLLNNYNLSSN